VEKPSEIAYWKSKEIKNNSGINLTEIRCKDVR
jgi:hypothetical protein